MEIKILLSINAYFAPWLGSVTRPKYGLYAVIRSTVMSDPLFPETLDTFVTLFVEYINVLGWIRIPTESYKEEWV